MAFKILPNWLRLEKGLVVEADVHNVPTSLLIGSNLADVVNILGSLSWTRMQRWDWYDVSAGNGFVYFRFVRKTTEV